MQSSRGVEGVLTEVLLVARGRPVFAAGGLVLAKDLIWALRLGAAGVMLGTRFLVTRESLAHRAYKRAVIAAEETVLTTCFDGGWPDAKHRVLHNPTLDAWEAAGRPSNCQRPGEGEIVAHDPNGNPVVRYDSQQPLVGATGQVCDMALYAGTGCAQITDAPAAAEVVAKVWSEAQALR